MQQISYLLGVDGGGTGCRVRLCDRQGRRLGEGRGGTANPRAGLEQALANIMTAVRQALQQAGLDEAVLARTAAGLGLAGTAQTKERELVLSWQHPFATLSLATDAETACLGAFQGNDGAILILGTGSCGVVNLSGRMQTIGGWGFPVSDGGSGARLGLLLLQETLLAHEGMTEGSALSRHVMDHFGGEPAQVVAWMDQALPRDYAGFAPDVFAYAQQHDPLAVSVVQAIAAQADQLITRLCQLGAPAVCLMGGMSQALEPWLASASRRILAQPQGDALQGALRLTGRLQENAA